MLYSGHFLEEFNKIETYLRKVLKVGKEFTFQNLVASACTKYSDVRYFSDDLKELGDLRNAIVHSRRDYIIAEPNEKAVELIKHISSVLLNPPKVVEFCSGKVSKLKLIDSVADAVKIMLAKSFSQIPIYNETQFVALLTSNTITRWLGKSIEEEVFSLKETLISTVLTFKEEKNWIENCCFLDRNQTVFAALEKFQDYEIRGKKLEALLITESGKSSENLLGMINVWDLPKIYAKIQ